MFVGLAILCSKNFNSGLYMQTFQPNLFIPAMLMININHFVLLSVILTWAVVKRSAQSKTCWLHFFTHF